VDFHGVLDWNRDGPGTVSDRTLSAWRRLLDEGYVPWCCSYIGSGGPKSAERRQDLADTCAYLAAGLGLSGLRPGGPSREGIYYEVVDARTGPNGKAACLKHHVTALCIDDLQVVCHSCEDEGIECYRVKPNIARNRKERQDPNYPSDYATSDDFADAVADLLSETPNTRLTINL